MQIWRIRHTMPNNVNKNVLDVFLKYFWQVHDVKREYRHGNDNFRCVNKKWFFKPSPFHTNWHIVNTKPEFGVYPQQWPSDFPRRAGCYSLAFLCVRIYRLGSDSPVKRRPVFEKFVSSIQCCQISQMQTRKVCQLLNNGEINKSPWFIFKIKQAKK